MNSSPSTAPDSPAPHRRPGRLRRWLLRSGIILATLVTLFYVEENWRSARAWNAVKTALEARHEPMTLEQLLPPVPDEENFYAAPLVQERYRAADPAWFKFKEGTLNEIIAEAQKEDGKLDLAAALKMLRACAAWPLPAETGRPAADLLAALAPAEKGLQDLQKAVSRPRAQMLAWQFDPHAATAGARFFIESARLHCLRRLALLEDGRQADAAAECVQALRLARRLAAQPPNLMQFLIATAVSGTTLSMLRTEAGEIPWTVSQLQAMEAELAATHFADHFDDILRAERVFALAWLENLNPDGTGNGRTKAPFGAKFLPSGWRLKWKASLCEALQQRIDGIAKHGLRTEMNTTRESGWFPPQPFPVKGDEFLHFQTVMKRALLSDREILSSRLALAAIRWRLEKNTWPESLTALAPYFPAGTPNDPLSGQPFTGATAADGTYIIKPPGADAGDAEDESVIKIKPPVRANP